MNTITFKVGGENVQIPHLPEEPLSPCLYTIDTHLVLHNRLLYQDKVRWYKKSWSTSESNRKDYPDNYTIRYEKGKFTRKDRKFMAYEGFGYQAIVYLEGLDVTSSMRLYRCFNSITVRGIDEIRYSDGSQKCFEEISPELRNKYFEWSDYKVFNEKTLEIQNKIGYKLIESCDVNFAIYFVLAEINDSNNYSIKGNTGRLLSISIVDFMKMSLFAKFRLLKRIKYVQNGFIHMLMYTKNSIGNLGRRTNTLSSIPKNDRALITNLYGVDMSSALQVIVSKVVKPVETIFTDKYIQKKDSIREYVAKKMNWEKDIAKMMITAIYQGKGYKKEFELLKDFFDERDIIRNEIYKKIDDDVEVSKYAMVSMMNKMKKEYKGGIRLKEFKEYANGKQNKIKNTFMFFYWTYYERIVQNIICERFKYSFPLHDAVYTQNEEEFKSLDINLLEKEILERTGIKVRLDK